MDPEFIVYEADGTALVVDDHDGAYIIVYEADGTELHLELHEV